jgi:DNA replication and repair protein RecF
MIQTVISAAPSASNFSTSAEVLAGPPTVWVSSLQLNGFRNYSSLNITTDRCPIVLVGSNGAGKTNIMEALSLLAPGRGLRRAKAQNWPYAPLSHSSPVQNTMDAKTSPLEAWSVSATVNTEDGPVCAGTGTKIQDDGEAGRRIIKLNGEMSSQAELAESFAVSWLTPEMDDVLAKEPSERRRFLDQLVMAFDSAHAGRLQRFKKLYRQRSRLLDEGRNDDAWLSALEAQMAESGVAIIAARQSLVYALDEEAALPQPAFPSARLHLEGIAEEWLKTMPAIDAEDRLASAARQARLNGQSALPGPTGSLLVVRHSETGQSAEMSSTGEQKALVISVVLAHARLQAKRLRRSPLLLLDDVVSHLDRDKRRALFALTSSLGGQVWFSGTDRSLFDDLGRCENDQVMMPQIFFIRDGKVTPKEE